MSDWKSHFEKCDLLLEKIVQKSKRKEKNLKFGKIAISASDVGLQYFCEKKVEMRHVHGDIKTESKIVGTEAHEKLLEGSAKIKRRELWQKIYSLQPIFALEMLLFAEYKGVILVGVADSILFMNGLPLLLLEYKFSKSGRPFRDHHVQARVYGLILENMGFNTDRLSYAIVIADPNARNNKELRKRVIDAIIKNRQKEAVLVIKDARVYLNKFDYAEAENDLDWAIGFWKNEREAIPTRNSNKCKSCEYNTKCEKSIN